MPGVVQRRSNVRPLVGFPLGSVPSKLAPHGPACRRVAFVDFSTRSMTGAWGPFARAIWSLLTSSPAESRGSCRISAVAMSSRAPGGDSSRRSGSGGSVRSGVLRRCSDPSNVTLRWAASQAFDTRCCGCCSCPSATCGGLTLSTHDPCSSTFRGHWSTTGGRPFHDGCVGCQRVVHGGRTERACCFGKTFAQDRYGKPVSPDLAARISPCDEMSPKSPHSGSTT